MNKLRRKKLLFNGVGLFISVVPVLVAILSYFPEWQERKNGSLMAGFVLLLILLALVPLFNVIKAALRTPSAKALWFIMFVLFFALSRIADEMTVISFVGFVTNLVGAIFFKAAERVGRSGGANEG